jgi:hypothetical protein
MRLLTTRDRRSAQRLAELVAALERRKNLSAHLEPVLHSPTGLARVVTRRGDKAAVRRLER